MPTYTDWVDWHPDPLEMVCTINPSPGDTYIDSVPINGIFLPTPIRLTGISIGNVHYSRAFGGEFPQEHGGLEAAWQVARYGLSENSLWPDAGTAIHDGILGEDTLTWMGASYSLHSDGFGDIFPGNGVDVHSRMSGWSFAPEELDPGWTGPLFTWEFEDDPEPTLLAEYVAAVEANTPPGDGWTTEWESGYPIFAGYEIACAEWVGSVADGEIFVGTASDGLGLSLDPDLNGVWMTGDYSVPLFLTYNGGAGAWHAVADNWIPGQDPETGALTPAEIGLVVLNCYIEFQSKLTPGTNPHIIPNPSSHAPDGFDLDIVQGRNDLAFAVKALWRPPRFRFVYPGGGSGRPRRVIGRTKDGLVGSGQQTWPRPSSRQRSNLTIGGTL